MVVTPILNLNIFKLK